MLSKNLMRKNGGEGRSRRVSSFQIYRNKKWVSSLYRTAQPNTLALFPTWGSQRELVVGDLPATKVVKKSFPGKLFMNHYLRA